MHHIIFDLEATCWDQHDRQDNETIEIGAVMVDDAGRTLSEFQTFVKPIRYPQLSAFCTKLTSIQQADVDDAPYFYEAQRQFRAWIGEGAYVLCSWGFYDRRQLEQDCALHNLAADWVTPHVSLKHQHAELRKVRRALGMDRAMEFEGLSLEGTHHRGIDDARNIAKIFVKYRGQWVLPKGV